MPKLYIISGCNGAGKTTASYSVLPDMLNCKEFVNADEIAKGLSPFQPEKVAIPEETIRRRYVSGIENLSKIYLPICDYWMIYDNSNPPSSIIAEGYQDKDIEIYKPLIYNQIISK